MTNNDIVKGLKNMRDILDAAIRVLQATEPKPPANGFHTFKQQEGAAPPAREPQDTTWTSRARNPYSQIELIAKLLNEHPDTRYDVWAVAAALGVAPEATGGISPNLSKLVRAGRIRRVAPGVYQGFPNRVVTPINQEESIEGEA